MRNKYLEFSEPCKLRIISKKKQIEMLRIFVNDLSYEVWRLMEEVAVLKHKMDRLNKVDASQTNATKLSGLGKSRKENK